MTEQKEPAKHPSIEAARAVAEGRDAISQGLPAREVRARPPLSPDAKAAKEPAKEAQPIDPGMHIVHRVNEKLDAWKELGGDPYRTFRRECELLEIVDAHATEQHAPYPRRLMARQFVALAAKALDTIPTFEILSEGMFVMSVLAASLIEGGEIEPIAKQQLADIKAEIEARMREQFDREMAEAKQQPDSAAA